MVHDPLGGSRRRRDRLFIMTEILTIAKEGSLKTHIMYKANMSFAQISEYLSLLLDLNLLQADENLKRTIFKTTEKGLRYLQSYSEIIELLNRGKEITRKKIKRKE